MTQPVNRQSYLQEPIPKRQCLENRMPNPKSWFDNPEQVSWDNLFNVATQALSELKSVSVIDKNENRKEKIFQACRVWFDKLKDSPWGETSQKVHSLCIELMNKAQQFEINARKLITFHLNDQTSIQITPYNFEILCMASPFINQMFSTNMQETKTNQSFLNIRKEVFEEICNKLINPEYKFNDETNKIELLSAVHYLGINPLKTQLLQILDQVVLDAKPEMLEEILVIYKTYEDLTYVDQDRIDLCLAALVKISFNEESVRKVTADLDFNAINALIPHLTFGVPSIKIEANKTIINCFAKIDTEEQDAYTDLRNLLEACECIKTKKFERASQIIQQLMYSLPCCFVKAHLLCAQNQHAQASRALPSTTEIWYFWSFQAHLAIKLNYVENAKSLFLKSLRLKPDAIETMLEYAKFLRQNNDIPETINCLNKVLNIEPENENALTEKAEALLCGGFITTSQNNSEALKVIDKLLEFYPFSGKGYYLKGLAKYQESKFQEACDEFSKSITCHFGQAHVGRLLCNHELGNHAEVSMEFSACSDYGWPFPLCYKIAMSLRKSNELDKAKTTIESALSLFSKHNNNNQFSVVPTLIEQTEIFLALADYQKAIETCDKVLSFQILYVQDIQKANLLKSRALRLSIQPQISWTIFLNVNPNQLNPSLLWDYNLELAQHSLIKCQFNKAIVLAHRLIKQKETSEVLVLRGDLYLNFCLVNNTEMKKLAIADYNRALALNPNYLPALQGLQNALNLNIEAMENDVLNQN